MIYLRQAEKLSTNKIIWPQQSEKQFIVIKITRNKHFHIAYQCFIKFLLGRSRLVRQCHKELSSGTYSREIKLLETQTR